jgi:hypothetical protein
MSSPQTYTFVFLKAMPTLRVGKRLFRKFTWRRLRMLTSHITPSTQARSEATSPARLRANVVLLVINDCGMIQIERPLLSD